MPSTAILQRATEFEASVERAEAEIKRLRSVKGLGIRNLRNRRGVKNLRTIDHQIRVQESKRLRALKNLRSSQMLAGLAKKREAQHAEVAKRQATAKKETDALFHDVAGNIAEEEGLIETAAGKEAAKRQKREVAMTSFRSAMKERIERIQNDATPEEFDRIRDLFFKGSDLASQGATDGQMATFRAAIEKQIAIVDKRVQGDRAATAATQKIEQQKKTLIDAQDRLERAEGDEKKKAKLDVQVAKKALGLSPNEKGPETEKPMSPDTAAAEAVRRSEVKDRDGRQQPFAEAIKSMPVEALIVGSFSKLKVDAQQRKAMFDAAEAKVNEEIRRTGNADTDEAAVRRTFNSIMDAMPKYLHTPENVTRILRALGAMDG